MIARKLQRRAKKIAAYAVLFCFTSLSGAQPLYAVPANTQLPNGFESVVGGAGYTTSGNVGTVTQTGQTAVNQWGDFSIGADATVNFTGPDGFNSVNLVNGGAVSEIYGQLSAIGGNIFIANPAGVQIGNSAQINVGSLYVTNKDLQNSLSNINESSSQTQIESAIRNVQAGTAELMSLGAIVDANKITFDGNRIVLDVDRLYKKEDNQAVQMTQAEVEGALNIITTDQNNVVLGYTAYSNSSYAGQDRTYSVGNGNGGTTNYKGYMWIEDVDQLQAMNTNLSGYYALRNSIDAYYKSGFTSIGTNSSSAFTGRLDGLGYSIFDLTISQNNNYYTGLFGYTNGAIIRNFTINGGTISASNANGVGAVVGSASGGIIENITNTASVTGRGQVGGIVGSASNVTMSNLVNTGTVTGTLNGVGGIVGLMTNGSLTGLTYNAGVITSTGEEGATPGEFLQGGNVGGIVGSATGAQIGDEDSIIYNMMDVTGRYNVGGIVGGASSNYTGTSGSITTVTNASNYGNITATGYDSNNNTYTYHTGETSASNIPNNGTLNGEVVTVNGVANANVGGIIGFMTDGEITNVYNEGDVTTGTASDSANGQYYTAGNVGGILGYGQNVTISGAENKENTVAGAHNVGGIVGSLTATTGNSSSVTDATNNGGDITGTGARTTDGNDFVKELVRPKTGSNDEEFIVGNFGGIVGQLYEEGGTVTVSDSTNRGAVHSQYITGSTVPDTAKAANVGGIVGKLDSGTAGTEDLLNQIKNGTATANITNSVNMGDVQGYTGIGGIVGKMYNGSIADSFNTGYVYTTRTASNATVDPANIGGIVGDSWNGASAMSVLYNVYNSGQIGDDTFTYYGRHVGGIAGRFAGYMDTSYNTGDIYNGYSTVGGLVGYWVGGNISNVFNTGNITVINNDSENNTTQVGGLIGAYYNQGNTSSLSYAYNLGTIRAYAPFTSTQTYISIGGLVGSVNSGTINISNVYATNNIYASKQQQGGTWGTNLITTDYVGEIVGRNNGGSIRISNAYFVNMFSGSFQNPTNATANNTGVTTISSNWDQSGSYGDFTFSNITTDSGWRIYGGTTPILNAFAPELSGYLENNRNNWGNINISNVQYGTAFNPLLTIIDATGDVTLNWGAAGISSNIISGGIVVNGGGLTINNVTNADFWGTIYADGDLTINASGDLLAGASSDIYGSSVTINTSGDVEAHGTITSTDGDVSIESTAGDVEVIGEIKSSTSGQSTTVAGIGKTVDTNAYQNVDFGYNSGNLADIATTGDLYSKSTDSAANNGDISISAAGDADVLYGNVGSGKITSGGSFTVESTGEGGNVYVDSDISGVGGDITLTADGEVLLDITNIAEAQGNSGLHDFLGKYADGQNNSITMTSTSDDVLITADLWNGSSFNTSKFDNGSNTLTDALGNISIGDGSASDIFYIWVSDAQQLATISSMSGHQNYNFALKNNIDATKQSSYTAIGGTSGYNGIFDGRGMSIAGLDSNSRGLFRVIGSDGVVKDLNVFASTFLGNHNTSGEADGYAGVIAAVNNGTITDITSLGNQVTGTQRAGGIAGINNGTISGVSSSDSVIANSNDSIAGGIAGENNGTINGVESDSAVRADNTMTSATIGGIVGKNNTNGSVENAAAFGVTDGQNAQYVGGIVGENSGNIDSVYNESIVSGGGGTGETGGLGGVAGSNSGTMSNVVNATAITATGDNIGGIAGTNSGAITSGRNAGAVVGNDYVGGIVGRNNSGTTLQNLSNALVASVTGVNYVGGLAGTNAGTITGYDGLVNEGTITGTTYVGGIAGENTGSIEELTNEMVVLITANAQNATYFGGVAGSNSGTISDVTNRSSVTATGASYVGGIAGINKDNGTLSGSLENQGDISGGNYVAGIVGNNQASILMQGTEDNLAVISNSGDITATSGRASGITDENAGDIIWAIVTNSGNISSTADYTGGLIGKNTGDVSNSTLANSGSVTGQSYTGGLIGQNTGAITGGRNDEDTMYVYKIYNNGAVSGTSNVGGLIGYNADESNSGGKTGSLYAGYNTGTVSASGSSVGGIVGTNAGTIDNVFNTIMTADGSNQTVSGLNLVGGIVGTNTGTISNAYNTTGVTATATTDIIVGNAVGRNDGSISSIYATNTSGSLIGTTTTTGSVENAYTFVEGDSSGTYISDTTSSGSYSGFDFSDTWKNYDGSGNPLLKVFLTKVTVDSSNLPDFVYNTTDHDIDISGWVTDGVITAADDFGAYGNNSSLIQNTNEDHINAGSYDNWLWSQQIAGSTTQDEDGNDVFDPNNLGYDIEFSMDIDKAQVTVDLGEVDRTYGSTNITSGGYDYTVGVGNTTMNDNLKDVIDSALSMGDVTDGALTGNTTGRVTNDAGDYDWSADFTLNDNNLTFIVNGQESSTMTVTGENKSTVNKADISITVNDVETIYGTAFDEGSYDYTFSGIVNGDLDSALKQEIIANGGHGGYVNTGAVTGGGPRVTENADGSYTISFGTDISSNSDLLKNYTITTVTDGTSTVNKAELVVTADDILTPMGTEPVYTGTTFAEFIAQLVNGDSLDIFEFSIGTEDATLFNIIGLYPEAIGMFFNGQFYGEGTHDFSSINEFFKNYNVRVDAGDLTVAYYDIPNNGNVIQDGWNMSGGGGDADEAHGGLSRERKAEIHFVKGGMVYDKNMQPQK